MTHTQPDHNNPTTPRPLFRQQALTHLNTKQYGTVILAKSLSFRWLTVLFVSLALGLIAFFVLFSTTRKAQTSGVLLPNTGVLRVVAGQAGVVVERRVREGQVVKAGEVLYVLRSERFANVVSNSNAVLTSASVTSTNTTASRSSTKPTDTQQALSQLMQERRESFSVELNQAKNQIQQRLSNLETRMQAMHTERERLAAQLRLQQERVALSEQQLKRFQELRATQFISPAQLQERQGELLDQQQRLADLRRLQASQERELQSTQAELQEVRSTGQRELANLARNKNGVEQDLLEHETRREFVVTAQHEGVVTAMLVEPGQVVNPNQALASILPSGSQLEAEIYAPSRAVGFVKPGMQVLLRYQAYPYQKFGQFNATVREVAQSSLRPEELGLLAQNGAEPVYRIRLSLEQQHVRAYGKELPLKSGMLVDAGIVLEQRRLYEWVLEPLLSISGRM